MRRLCPLLATLSWLLPTATVMAKPHVLDGFVDIAPATLVSQASHVLKDEPNGRILLALRDLTRELRAIPNCRQRLLGVVSHGERTDTGIPLLDIIEVRAANWIEPRVETALASYGLWNGTGSSLYPSLPAEPLPGPGFTSVGPLDTDRDGVPDTEDAFPNDPFETLDTDGDKTGNNADPDDDNDEIPDLYEIQFGLNSLVDDADDDLDLDGLNNLGEFIAGTAANDPSSVLALFKPTFKSTVGIQLKWPSVVGRLYEVHFSETADGVYQVISSSAAADEAVTSIDLPTPPGMPRGFYRIQVRQP